MYHHQFTDDKEYAPPQLSNFRHTSPQLNIGNQRDLVKNVFLLKKSQKRVNVNTLQLRMFKLDAEW